MQQQQQLHKLNKHLNTNNTQTNNTQHKQKQDKRTQHGNAITSNAIGSLKPSEIDMNSYRSEFDWPSIKK